MKRKNEPNLYMGYWASELVTALALRGVDRALLDAVLNRAVQIRAYLALTDAERPIPIGPTRYQENQDDE